MRTSRRLLRKNSALAAAGIAVGGRLAYSQEPPIRIGVVYDLSGPFAAGGSVACSLGAQIAIDLVNERGGIARKYKVAPINADCQSKVDVAINEVERLIDQEKVESSMAFMPARMRCRSPPRSRRIRRFSEITTAIATAVFKDKNLQYVFRAQIHSDQYGEA